MEKIDLVDFNKKRVPIEEVFKTKSKNVEIAGWVHNTRELGKIRFILLKDLNGMVQVTAVKGKVSDKVFETMKNLTRESVIYVKGSVKETKQAPGGKEIVPDEIIILNQAEDLPIDIPFSPGDEGKTELPKRLDYRFLDLHRKRIQAIFKIQSNVATAFREFFAKNGFTEVQLPSIISSSSEGGTELFEAKYFDKKAYLAQSPQLYKQMLACSPFEKVYTITPVWRAEKHNTIRHLNECRQMDIEVGFANAMVAMNLMEESVKHIVEQVLEKNKEELKLLEIELKIPKAKYITFKETLDILKKHGVKVEKDDLSQEAERKLDEIFPDTIVFVHDWPLSGKPFYIMPKGSDSNAELSEGFDAIYRGMEISSGGQRIHIPELLEKRLKAKKMNPKNFKSYIDSFRFGAPPHAGWSIGIERFTQVLLKLPNVREGVLFPRDRDRLTP